MKIVMTLKSDTIPGSGTSLAGIIDRDVAYDKNGLPYIPAKRLKGVLRESAEELRLANIDEIFGLAGQSRAAAFRLDNGLLENYKEYSNLLQSKKINEILPAQAVLDYFTYTRSQTTIENGTAKENSLRISRVLKRGLRFNFDLECKPDHLSDLEDICKITRSLGTSRNRGFGEVELELIYDKNSADNMVPPVNCANLESAGSQEFSVPSRIRVVVTNLEQLLVSTRPGNTQISENHIPGTVLLGALAGQYLKSHKDTEEQFIEMFLSGKVSFGNLYPFVKDSSNEEFYYPAPLSIKKVKENKVGAINTSYYDHLLFDDDDEDHQKTLQEAIFKGGLSGYVTSDLCHSIDTVKDVEAHHWRPENRQIAKATKKEGDFFQFEVISMNQDFAGEIIGPRHLLVNLIRYFPKNGIIRLGKSKTGQYGKCIFSWNDIEKISSCREWGAGEELKIVFRSDMIMLNEAGFAVPDVKLFVKELAVNLGVEEKKLEILRQFTSTANSGGFMGVWRMPRPQNPALSAGTVVELRNNSGESIKIINIESLQFGARTEDGYGRIAEHSYFDEDGRVSEPEPQEKDSLQVAADLNEMKPADRALLEFRINQIVERELLAQAIQNADKPISINSFISKLIKFIDISASYRDFKEKVAAIGTEKQKANLKKIASEIFISTANNNIDKKKFSKLLEQALPPVAGEDWINCINASLLEPEPPFALYKFYVKNYLVLQKLRNRG